MKWLHLPFFIVSSIGIIEPRLLAIHDCTPIFSSRHSDECQNETYACSIAMCCDFNCKDQVVCENGFQCGGGRKFTV